MARNCSLVPLRVEFPKGGMTGTPFDGQTTLKLGTGCDDSKEYEQITLREYLQYPMFNLVTPLSFRARLARATYVDEKSKKKSAPRYALFIEHENDVARRAEGRVVELPRMVFKDLDEQTLTRMMLFEYMIGNTDMSIWALHNVRIDPEAEPHADRRCPTTSICRASCMRPTPRRIAGSDCAAWSIGCIADRAAASTNWTAPRRRSAPSRRRCSR